MRDGHGTEAVRGQIGRTVPCPLSVAEASVQLTGHAIPPARDVRRRLGGQRERRRARVMRAQMAIGVERRRRTGRERVHAPMAARVDVRVEVSRRTRVVWAHQHRASQLSDAST